jgi:hypothetical protein
VPRRVFEPKRDEVMGEWRRGASWFVLFAKYNYNNEVEEDEMGGACSTNGGEKERV